MHSCQPRPGARLRSDGLLLRHCQNASIKEKLLREKTLPAPRGVTAAARRGQRKQVLSAPHPEGTQSTWASGVQPLAPPPLAPVDTILHVGTEIIYTKDGKALRLLVT